MKHWMRTLFLLMLVLPCMVQASMIIHHSQQKLTASDSTSGSFFGFCMAESQATLVIGAPFDGDKGAAYIFEFNSNTGQFDQKAKLVPADVHASLFGYSVAIDGDTVVVGDIRSGANGSGAAYVFVRPQTGWAGELNESAFLYDPGGESDDHFGTSVAASGDVIAVGSPYKDVVKGVDTLTDAGAVFVFNKGSGWAGNISYSANLVPQLNQQAKMTFGLCVAAIDDYVVAGSQNLYSSSGAGWLFVKPVDGWAGTLQQTTVLGASDSNIVDGLGKWVAIDGDIVVIGAPGRQLSFWEGSAYVYEKPVSGWPSIMIETAKLTASDGSEGNGFGGVVAISGDRILASSNAWYTYQFEKSAGGWATGTVSSRFRIPDAVTEMKDTNPLVLFGNSQVLIGAPYNDTQTGAVYLMQKSDVLTPMYLLLLN